MKFEIKNRFSGEIIFSIETDSFKLAVEAAIESDANLYGANLSGANLTGANLTGANLSVANLYGANLTGAYLTDANLSGANLTGANLTGAYLYGAHLTGANLSRAHLYRANLYGANLTGAYLYGAHLYGYFSFGPGGSRQSYTCSRWEADKYMVYCGCFTGSIEDFKAAVEKTHGDSYHGKWYKANIKTMELVMEESREANLEYLKNNNS